MPKSSSASALPCLPLMTTIMAYFCCCCLNVTKANPDNNAESPTNTKLSMPTSSQWDEYRWSDDDDDDNTNTYLFNTNTHKQFWSDHLYIILVIAIPSFILIGSLIGIMAYQRYKNREILAGSSSADRIIAIITSINRNDDEYDDDDDDDDDDSKSVLTATITITVSDTTSIPSGGDGGDINDDTNDGRLSSSSVENTI
jgi:hypothetical protein